MSPTSARGPTRALEITAVVLSLLYTYAYAQGWLWAWYAGMSGSVLFAILTYRSGLLAEVGTHFFYLLSAVYGWVLQSGKGIEWGLTVPEWGSPGVPFHIAMIVLCALLGGVLGRQLARNPRAQTPYFDAQTTVFSILATVLMIHFDRSNWVYWIAIDAASTVLYGRRGLRLSAAMYGVYTAMALYGAWTAYVR